jgi:hypothetical protein
MELEHTATPMVTVRVTLEEVESTSDELRATIDTFLIGV